MSGGCSTPHEHGPAAPQKISMIKNIHNNRITYKAIRNRPRNA